MAPITVQLYEICEWRWWRGAPGEERPRCECGWVASARCYACDRLVCIRCGYFGDEARCKAHHEDAVREGPKFRSAARFPELGEGPVGR